MPEEIKPIGECLKEFHDQMEILPLLDAETIVCIAEEVGKFLKNGQFIKNNKIEKVDLRLNQLRRFLDALRRIEVELKGKIDDDKESILEIDFNSVKDSVELLRPKLAYAAGREEKVKPLMNVLDPAIKAVTRNGKKEAFVKLLRLVESIIAYHRYHGGTN